MDHKLTSCVPVTMPAALHPHDWICCYVKFVCCYVKFVVLQCGLLWGCLSHMESVLTDVNVCISASLSVRQLNWI